jgi:hypothetical protein
MEQAHITIAPAQGKLGVLLPGMGAVSTTLIAGVELVKKGLGRTWDHCPNTAPFGSANAQMTIAH